MECSKFLIKICSTFPDNTCPGIFVQLCIADKLIVIMLHFLGWHVNRQIGALSLCRSRARFSNRLAERKRETSEKEERKRGEQARERERGKSNDDLKCACMKQAKEAARAAAAAAARWQRLHETAPVLALLSLFLPALSTLVSLVSLVSRSLSLFLSPVFVRRPLAKVDLIEDT